MRRSLFGGSFSLVLLLALAASPAQAWRMSAWVPSWDPNAVTIMQTQAGALDETNPGWYTIAADGSVVKNWGAEDPTMRAALSGTTLVPTIKNYINGRFDGATVATIIANPTLREAHVNALVNLVNEQAFDGIDIDYERVPTTSRADLTAFVQLLSQKLHASGKLLSYTVVAKTGDDADWTGPGAQDWVAIGAAADSVKIMGYDYHWSTSDAGPLAPIDWLDAVATYAEAAIPNGKSILGLPWYGYDWLGTSGDTVTYADAMRIATANGATVSHDANGEATFTYAGRTVYFQDAAGYKKKIDHLTAYHPRLGGFAAWRVGAEDPAIWPLVAELKYSMSSAVSPAPGDFAINSPAAVSLKAGALTTAKLGLVPINGFDGSADITVEKLDDFPGTVLLSSATVRVGVATTVTITTPANTRAGVYTLRVKMASPMVAHEQMLTISVQAAPSTATFRLDAPQRVTLARGATSQFALNVLPDSALEENPRVTARFVDPFSGSVALSATTIAASSPVGVSVTADRFAANGTYRLELTVQTTAVVRTQIVNVVVSGGKSRAVR